MWNRITRVFKESFYSTAIYLLFGVWIYLVTANIVFAFRHPWATSTERFVHIGDSLMFKKISYKEMRGMYDKE